MCAWYGPSTRCPAAVALAIRIRSEVAPTTVVSRRAPCQRFGEISALSPHRLSVKALDRKADTGSTPSGTKEAVALSESPDVSRGGVNGPVVCGAKVVRP